MMAAHGADGGTGSARRRRERRLRSWLRHEQQSIAAVLATVTHHSFDKVGTASGVLRNQKTATRTGKGEESEKKYTAKFRKTPPLQAAATVYYPMTDDEGGELSAGVRPAPLEEGRPQGKLERHAGIGYEIVQNFDVPVPQMVEQLPNVLRFFATRLPVVSEQVIEVPKILPHDVPPRRLCRDTQLVEQLVEVPTIVSWSLLQRIMEQNVGIQFLVVEGEALVYKVFFPDRVQQRRSFLQNAFLSGLWSRSSTFLLPVAAFKIFAQDRVHLHLLTIQLVVMELWIGLVKGFFRTFPQIKKRAGVTPHSRSELAADSSPSTRRAYGVPIVVEEDEFEPVTESELEDEGEINAWVDDNGDSWVLFQSVHGPFWRNITKQRSQWHPPWRRLR